MRRTKREYNERYALLHPERIKRITRAINWRRKLEVIAKYGGACAHCGDVRPEVLTIDHIKGDGAAHRKIMSNTKFYQYLRNNPVQPEDYRLLCYNCNCCLGHRGVLPPIRLPLTTAPVEGYFHG